jgi:hypothetical protein
METLLKSTDLDRLIGRLQHMIRLDADSTPPARLITDMLMNEGIDLRHEPTLDEMKSLLIETSRARAGVSRIASMR